jgi:hypothetical protein
MSQPTSQQEQLSEEGKTLALFIAKYVRDHLEDIHARYIPDKEMKNFNTILRDSIATALHMIKYQDESKVADYVIRMVCRSVPDDWEPPKLTKEYLEALDRAAKQLPPFN